MKIIFFNIWHGKVWEKLKEFIKSESSITDVFCFMETNPDLMPKLKKELAGFECFFDKGTKIDYWGGIFEGQSIFFNPSVKVTKIEKINLFEVDNQDTGGLNVAEININGKDLVIGEVKGKPRPGHKLDTPARIKQSEIIIKSFQKYKIPVIIGGDFNLLPETQSIKLFEESGYRNLIKEFGIESTRNQLCWDQFPEEVEKFGKQYHADYCFTKGRVTVNDFSVPSLNASDHEPLILNFDI